MASSVNAYCSLSELKSILGISSTTDDIPMRKIIESTSRMIESYCNRFFYSTYGIKYFQGAGLTIWLPDVLSIVTLETDEDGDGSFENTFSSTVPDYFCYGGGLEDTLNTYPITHLGINPFGTFAAFGIGIKRGCRITGTWGYGDGTSATPYVQDTTLSAAIISTTATSVSVTSGTNLSAAMTILVDSEQMYITNVTSNTLTVERGINGTTAATHSNGAQIYYYRYPQDVRQSCIDVSALLYQNRNKVGMQSEHIGDYSYTLPSDSKKTINDIFDGRIDCLRRLRF